jgi:molecular chaperone GrpE
MSKKDKTEQEDIQDPKVKPEEEPATEAEAAAEVDETAELRQLLAEAEAEAATNLDGWQRAQAEFVNFRKRVERDQARMYEDTAARVIKRILPVLDDLNRAMPDRPTEGEAGEWANGIELVARKLQGVLESEGVSVMKVEGEMFDPNLHEAISQEESPDHESGQIIEVIQQGYMIGDRVLRAALVRVAA